MTGVTLLDAPDAADLAAWSARLASARERLLGVAHRTPTITSRTLDGRVGATVFLKCENLQRIGAFKFRGAWNAISRLDDAARARGVVAFSSGNHAQAVALACRELSVPCTIVMPSTAPRLKREATLHYGADLVHDDLLGEAREDVAERLVRERGATLVPPFDHPDILCGQGTATAELIEEVGPLDLLVVPVGGGGLISGSALAAAAGSRGCRVIGVEPVAGDDGGQSFRAGHRVTIPVPDTIADGARTRSLGVLTFALIRRWVHDMTSVPDAALIEAIRFAWTRLKLVVEPTGALGLAALLEGAIDARGRRVGVIISGGNLDPSAAANWLTR